jgi:hypothetical protein
MNVGKDAWGQFSNLSPNGWRTGVLMVLTALLLAGCGYSLQGGRGSFAPGVRTVFVDVFTNKTSEANADSIFRIAFSNQIVQNGHFKLARSPEEADAIFRGTILGLQSSPLAYKASNLSAEDRITVTMQISFEERASGKVFWSNDAYTGTGDYPVTTVGATEDSRRNALTKLANDTAERAYRLMMSDF